MALQHLETRADISSRTGAVEKRGANTAFNANAVEPIA